MSGKPILKVGIISDVQAYPFAQDWGMHNCEKAFQMLAPKGIDVLVNAGDLGDHGDDDGPDVYYRKMMEQYFHDKLPVQVVCAGNHDYWNHLTKLSQDDIFKRFCAALGEPDDNPCRKVIGGYDFIAFSSDNEHDYNEEDCERLRPAIEAAVARDPNKPIFVVTHKHPINTVVGSFHDSGKTGLRKLFNQYPQIVSLSGHTHCPLEDERCIWQGEFTALNTCTLSYGCTDDPGYENVVGSILPYAREVVDIMYMEIFEDRLEFHRYNVEEKREIKPDKIWTVRLPYDPSKPVYGDNRRAESVAPEFEPGTQLYFRIDYGYVYLLFEGAKHPDFTHGYRLVMTELKPDGTEAAPMEAKYLSNCFRLERNRDPRMILRFPHNTLEKGKTYRFEVYPFETFGKEGKPLTLVASVPPTYGFRNDPEIRPIE